MGAVFLYIIQAGEYCKVGFSKNPKKRLGEVATGCPFKPTLKFFKKVENVVVMEKRCHEVLKVYHTHLEWFKIDYDTCFDTVTKVLTNWSYQPSEEPETDILDIDPEKFTLEQAQSFINRSNYIIEDDEFLASVGIPKERPKAWKFRVDYILKTYYGDLK